MTLAIFLGLAPALAGPPPPPGVELDPTEGVVPVQFQAMLSACHRIPVSMAVDYGPWSHHAAEDTPFAFQPIRWDAAETGPFETLMHAEHVGLALRAFNRSMSRVPSRNGERWQQLQPYYDHTLIRPSKVDFLDQCVTENQTSSPVTVVLGELLEQCNDGSYTRGRHVEFDAGRLAKHTYTLQPGQSRSLADLLYRETDPWRFICYHEPDTNGGGYDACVFAITGRDMVEHEGTRLLYGSADRIGSTGCSAAIP